MRKSIGTDYRLVGLDHEAGGLADHAAGSHDVQRVDVHVQVKVIAARFHCHDDLFERAIAGTLAQAVDGALHLTCAADLHAGQ